MAYSSTSFPKKWKSKDTTVVRVPKALAEDLLNIAHILDGTETYRIQESPNQITFDLLPVKQITSSFDKPINVASVPQRSPFRYPGGKTWLVPYIRQWLRSRPAKPSRLVEPFAGGAIVSLTAAIERLVNEACFSELDGSVAAVWRVVLSDQAEWLANRIKNFVFTEDSVHKIIHEAPLKERDLAFQTILRNRVQRGGILAPGAGLIKTGEGGKGLGSRWYPETIANRIREIAKHQNELIFTAEDGFNLLAKYRSDSDTVFYIDPPYTKAAKRLYTTWKMDHEALFYHLSLCKGDFLMSYDNDTEVANLADKFGFQYRAISMKSSHHAKMTELLISRDLSWIEF